MYFNMWQSNFETLLSDTFDVISETKEVTLECTLVCNIPFKSQVKVSLKHNICYLLSDICMHSRSFWISFNVKEPSVQHPKMANDFIILHFQILKVRGIFAFRTRSVLRNEMSGNLILVYFCEFQSFEETDTRALLNCNKLQESLLHIFVW